MAALDKLWRQVAEKGGQVEIEPFGVNRVRMTISNPEGTVETTTVAAEDMADAFEQALIRFVYDLLNDCQNST